MILNVITSIKGVTAAVKAFQKCGFNIDKVVFETDTSNHDDDLASLEAHIQQEDEQSAREATEKLEK